MISLKLFVKYKESFPFGELFCQNNAKRKIFGERSHCDEPSSDIWMSIDEKIRSNNDSERIISTNEKLFLPEGTFDLFSGAGQCHG